jgi:predicted small metal-binding protein
MKKIISIHNSTPHILTTCSCGWQGGGNNNNAEARRELFSHMKKNNCKTSSIEIARISQYKLVSDLN